jgi:hypothetical protein
LRTKYRHIDIDIFENSNIGIYREAPIETLMQAYKEGLFESQIYAFGEEFPCKPQYEGMWGSIFRDPDIGIHRWAFLRSKQGHIENVILGNPIISINREASIETLILARKMIIISNQNVCLYRRVFLEI